MDDYLNELGRHFWANIPPAKVARKEELNPEEENALNHYWLVSMFGRGFADWREGRKAKPLSNNLNTMVPEIISNHGLFTSDQEDRDYHNHRIAERFIKEGEHEKCAYCKKTLTKAARSIKNKTLPWQ